MVRMSFGCYNDRGDVDRLVEMLHGITRGDYKGDYEVEASTGEYIPKGYEEPLKDYFLLDEDMGDAWPDDRYCGI